jgi:hypothetical protein
MIENSCASIQFTMDFLNFQSHPLRFKKSKDIQLPPLDGKKIYIHLADVSILPLVFTYLVYLK